MKIRHLLAIALILAGTPFTCGQAFPIPENLVNNAFAGRRGAFVIIDILCPLNNYRP